MRVRKGDSVEDASTRYRKGRLDSSYSYFTVYQILLFTAFQNTLLDQRWRHRVSAYSNDFTDQEAIATILRITKGNIRLIERLMMQVELVLVANQLTVVTKEVVETARRNLIIGPD